MSLGKLDILDSGLGFGFGLGGFRQYRGSIWKLWLRFWEAMRGGLYEDIGVDVPENGRSELGTEE